MRPRKAAMQQQFAIKVGGLQKAKVIADEGAGA
jgi:hypothetical protein